MGHRTPLVIVIAAVAAAMVPTAPASAGVSFGISVGGGGFAFSLGYSDYPVYSPAWSSPGFSLSFETTLAGYGEWVHVGGLGRVWRPYVAPGWRPYTWGRWVYTPMGWTWVAYEPWGYVPHHYGSWAFTTFGWVWQPGYVYTPANVAWVSYGACVGWYAAPPPGWSHAQRAYWRGYDHGYGDGYRDGWRDARYANFVEWNRFTARNVAAVARPGSEIRGLSHRSVRMMGGPPARDRIERVTGTPVRTVPVAERSVRMGDRTVRAVRPEGVARSVERYSRAAVRSGLAPSISRTLDRGGRVVPVTGHGGTSSRPATPARTISRRSSARHGSPSGLTGRTQVRPRGSWSGTRGDTSPRSGRAGAPLPSSSRPAATVRDRRGASGRTGGAGTRTVRPQSRRTATHLSLSAGSRSRPTAVTRPAPSRPGRTTTARRASPRTSRRVAVATSRGTRTPSAAGARTAPAGRRVASRTRPGTPSTPRRSRRH